MQLSVAVREDGKETERKRQCNSRYSTMELKEIYGIGSYS